MPPRVSIFLLLLVAQVACKGTGGFHPSFHRSMTSTRLSSRSEGVQLHNGVYHKYAGGHTYYSRPYFGYYRHRKYNRTSVVQEEGECGEKELGGRVGKTKMWVVGQVAAKGFTDSVSGFEIDLLREIAWRGGCSGGATQVVVNLVCKYDVLPVGPVEIGGMEADDPMTCMIPSSDEVGRQYERKTGVGKDAIFEVFLGAEDAQAAAVLIDIFDEIAADPEGVLATRYSLLKTDHRTQAHREEEQQEEDSDDEPSEYFNFLDWFDLAECLLISCALFVVCVIKTIEGVNRLRTAMRPRRF